MENFTKAKLITISTTKGTSENTGTEYIRFDYKFTRYINIDGLDFQESIKITEFTPLDLREGDLIIFKNLEKKINEAGYFDYTYNLLAVVKDDKTANDFLDRNNVKQIIEITPPKKEKKTKTTKKDKETLRTLAKGI